ncbi:cation:proton antiporter [Jatrophihabitans sp. DSM 45814]
MLILADSPQTRPALSALFVVCLVAAIVPIVSHLLPDRPPQVVLLLLGGILIGPSVFDLAKPADIQLIADLGLGFLFLLAGYEVEATSLRGTIGRRAIGGWLASLGLATIAVFLMSEIGFIRAPVPIAIGLTTTALGTLLPIMRDRGMQQGILADCVTACGAVGELLPVLGIALVLGAYSSWIEVIAISAVCAVGWALTTLGRRARGTALERVLAATAHGTAQTTLRWTMVILVGLLLLTSRFGIDSVLGAFLAGLVLRHWTSADAGESFDRKLDTIGYGLFIPVFFVVSGMSLDLASIGRQPIRLLLFFFLLIAVRGLPLLIFFRGVLRFLPRLQLMFLSATTLPLLVAVTTLGVQDGHMLPANAAALVGAGMLSVAVCPLIGIRVLGSLDRKSTERDSGRSTAISSGP